MFAIELLNGWVIFIQFFEPCPRFASGKEALEVVMCRLFFFVFCFIGLVTLPESKHGSGCSRPLKDDFPLPRGGCPLP